MTGEKVRQMAEICGGKQIDIIGSGYNKEVIGKVKGYLKDYWKCLA